MSSIVEKARKVARQQFEHNKAPAWGLTELAVTKGRALAAQYGAKEDLVVVALYLAHAIFSEGRNDDVQQNHPAASADLVEPLLKEWGMSEADQAVVLNAIRAHHDAEPVQSKEAEVMKNAECFKFLTLEGISLFLADLRRRGYTHDEAAEYAMDKMNQKMNLLTLTDCATEASRNREKILAILSAY